MQDFAGALKPAVLNRKSVPCRYVSYLSFFLVL